MSKERCDLCNMKMVYQTYAHASSDASDLNRKKRNTGHLEPYRGPCGHWHVGRHESVQHHRHHHPHPDQRNVWTFRDWLREEVDP